MKLSRMADYGVALMSEIASLPGRVHSAQALAAATGLPLPTVSKLLSALARAGLLEAIRGVKGGFLLARRPRHISMAEIIAAVDGPVALTQCIERGPGVCDVESFCTTRRGWQAVNDAVRNALAGVSLADFAEPAWPGRDASVRAVGEQTRTG